MINSNQTKFCPKCHIIKPITDFYANKNHQNKCRECYHLQNKEWYNRNRIKRCKQTILWGKRNKDKRHTYDKRAKQKLRITVLTHYGNNKCACTQCGETRLPCLSIDHINGGGNKHRKSFLSNSGQAIYRWLFKENYPLGFRTLCMNCQFVNHYYQQGELTKSLTKEIGD